MIRIPFQQKRRIAISVCFLAVALGFTGWRMQSAFAGRAQSGPSGANAADQNLHFDKLTKNDAPLGVKDAEIINIKKTAAAVFSNVDLASENPFEQIARFRREAAEAKLALQKTLEAGNRAAPGTDSRPSESTADPEPRPSIINIRALVDAGAKSVVLYDDRVLRIGDALPDGSAVFEKVENGKAWFRRGAGLVAAAPSKKK
ncbi:MAG: hypothetical protein HY286_15025 [Planctomycetes bacterium]|nr:hypothetical protein [Planctomycetota bacterium]